MTTTSTKCFHSDHLLNRRLNSPSSTTATSKQRNTNRGAVNGKNSINTSTTTNTITDTNSINSINSINNQTTSDNENKKKMSSNPVLYAVWLFTFVGKIVGVLYTSYVAYKVYCWKKKNGGGGGGGDGEDGDGDGDDSNERFRQMIDDASREEEQPLLDQQTVDQQQEQNDPDHHELENEKLSFLNGYEHCAQLDQAQEFILHIVKKKRKYQHNGTIVPVINNPSLEVFNFDIVGDSDTSSSSPSSPSPSSSSTDGVHNPLHVLVRRNQANTQRDINLLYLNGETIFQDVFHFDVSFLHKLMNRLEGQCRKIVRKHGSGTKPLILVVSRVDALDDEVLDVLKTYSRKWSAEPERFGIGMVFAGNQVAGKFRTDKDAIIWDYGTDLSSVLFPPTSSQTDTELVPKEAESAQVPSP